MELQKFNGDESNWEEAFGPDGANTAKGVNAPAPGYDIDVKGFVYEDIVEVRHQREGEHDGDPWLAIGRLKDGRWFFLSAWCDYTGWG